MASKSPSSGKKPRLLLDLLWLQDMRNSLRRKHRSSKLSPFDKQSLEDALSHYEETFKAEFERAKPSLSNEELLLFT